MKKLLSHALVISTLFLSACQSEANSSYDAWRDDQLILAQNADGASPVFGALPTSSDIVKVNRAAKNDGVRRLQDEQNTIDIFEQLAPATVFVTQNQIQVQRNWLTFQRTETEVPAGSGSGFIWDKKGHIVTNFHVVQGGSSYSVTLANQKTYSAKLIGVDPKKDIAVLKINAPQNELTPVKMPSDNYQLQVGQKAIAIGNPFGLDHTLTTGIISSLGREIMGIGGVKIRDMIQTDASINVGNSGGPLLDSAGQLIGMNTMIFSPSGSSAGIGFAVPYMFIKRIVPQIIATGKPQQVGLGISIISDEVARKNGIKGVIIREVGENSPAAKAGLIGITQTRNGDYINDIIVGIDGKPVTNYDQLYNALDVHKPGETVNVSIRRKDKVIEVPVKLTTI